ncbi:P-loop containing nucleoside triphosphate hydrolase protein [Nadsonia fulvescens var. elongata DSM 6958]|uniref:p-loop containing nucleoside triphosphate hydrolase protein n=1 Tax=Nadsonia fulvescens var. elongata DSM 6958 TaxID=857566 RepID=A0A1E3PKM5_9ASCO|nr:P-loop containing nucleoside triphosphate hydrolase protein [Nadsonia fulvescens var. elongata DSM 6958]
MNSNIDKIEIVISFSKSLSPEPLPSSSPSPLIVGICGPQGSGKSTLVKQLYALLTTGRDYNYRVVQVSIDDFYLKHEEQIELSYKNPGNQLLALRGEPGTHDIKLAINTISALISQKNDGATVVPRYDKSCYGGSGDRLPVDQWETQCDTVDIILFEGWCIGFKALDDDYLIQLVHDKKQAAINDAQMCHIAKHPLEHIQVINNNLRSYIDLWNLLDCFLQLDTQNINNVYKWRLQQEHQLIRQKGSGLTDDQVVNFINGYMPAYELYLPRLRSQKLTSGKDSHLRIEIDQNRQLVDYNLVN